MEQQLTLPSHLGIILDGNRRWAQGRGKNSLEGHRNGYQNFRDITKHAFDRGVKYVSTFVFSTDNWERSQNEVKFLMNLAFRVVTKDVSDLNENNIRVLWLGSREKLTPKLIKAIEGAEEATKNNTGGTLCLCFNYGGHQEITDAVKAIIESNVKAEAVDQKLIEQYLYKPSVPPLDLIIRTSGERRTSGFMLFRSAYAEFYFTDKFWPDFHESDLDDALADYSSRSRRFGK